MEWHPVLALGIPLMVFTFAYLGYEIIDGIYTTITEARGKANVRKEMKILARKQHSRL